ncbi:MAG: glucokinase [candidate division Zixibacteria bacterium]|nr:glucokinase [candidate division Zixibacteria bacterium]
MLAGYISGATVELARVNEIEGGIKLVNQVIYNSRDFTNFEQILNLYLKKNTTPIKQACFGVAGPVINGEVRTTNLPWLLTASTIQEQFKIGKVKLLNDIVALAHGLPQIKEDRYYVINQGAKQKNGNVGLIAAGAGLGEALIQVHENVWYPYASEGGHAGFAPSSQREMELWEYLYSELGNVEVEDVVSLKGLERIYNFVLDSHGKPPALWFEKAIDKPGTLIERALSGKDADATQTLDIFIDCYASEAANLALKGMTLGGIFIGGLIGPQIITLLDQGRFMERFIKRGKMESLLARMPVSIVIEEKTALIGAGTVALRESK